MTSAGKPACEITLLIPARGCADTLAQTVSTAHAAFSREWADRFEILIIPNGITPGDRTLEVAEEVARTFATGVHPVRVCPHLGVAGKGAALRTGVLQARGTTIGFTDADLPYDLGFFTEAMVQLSLGFDLVTGNRRLPESVFDMPVELLKIAYRRHRLGLLFNRMVRMLLSIHTTDTQSGLKLMSRKLALKAFTDLQCPGFFFDLEIFLNARAEGMAHTELPVTLRLKSEKSTVRVLRESFLAGLWLIRFRARLSQYLPPLDSRALGQKILGRYSTAKLFLALRWRLTPYEFIAALLPTRGTLLDLGSGHGLLSLTLALRTSQQIVGIDHDDRRVALAREAARGIPHLSFTQGSLVDFAGVEGATGAVLMDVLHYFNFATQERIIKRARSNLVQGGMLLVREVQPGQSLASRFNQFYEKCATSLGFTRSIENQLFFRTHAEWESVLRRAGFKVRSQRCGSRLFADILYICTKEATP